MQETPRNEYCFGFLNIYPEILYIIIIIEFSTFASKVYHGGMKYLQLLGHMCQYSVFGVICCLPIWNQGSWGPYRAQKGAVGTQKRVQWGRTNSKITNQCLRFQSRLGRMAMSAARNRAKRQTKAGAKKKKTKTVLCLHWLTRTFELSLIYCRSIIV